MCSEEEKNEYKTAGKAGGMTGKESMKRFQEGMEGAVKTRGGSVEGDVP